MTKILSLGGKKGSGKTSLVHFLYRNKAELFPGRSVELVNFADPLKKLCVEVLGLRHEQVYGTEGHKNTPTEYRWDEFPCRDGLDHNEAMSCAFMTGREVLQQAGTGFFRTWRPTVWAEALVRRVRKDAPDVALIGDMRFPDEMKAVRDAGGKCVRLTRNEDSADTHESETALDGVPNGDWDLVLHNHKMGLDESQRALVSVLKFWGWAS